MEIDFSKAPVGATHFHHDCATFKWYRLASGHLLRWNDRLSAWQDSVRNHEVDPMIGLSPIPNPEDGSLKPRDLGSAPDFLNAALSHMQDRAATYDAPQGERSMGKTVTAFNALTGHDLTEEQGWLFMQVLKAARTQQGAFRADNYEDGAAYVALMGEAAAQERGNAKA